MKYVVCVPDGCADEPVAELDGCTPLEVAHLPNLKALAARGEVGRAAVIPAGMAPGSDVGNMAIFGYDPATFHTGRAPIEAAALGLRLRPDQIAYRCNLVTVTDGVMVDFAGGHPSTEDATKAIEALQDELGGDGIEFHAGVEYRHIMVAPAELHRRHLRSAPRPVGQAGGAPRRPGRPPAAPADGGVGRRRGPVRPRAPTRSGCGARATSPRCPASARSTASTPRSAAPSTWCGASVCSPTSRWSTSRA